jgi:hypothetical protein
MPELDASLRNEQKMIILSAGARPSAKAIISAFYYITS